MSVIDCIGITLRTTSFLLIRNRKSTDKEKAMKILVRLYRDGVTVRLTTTYQPELFKDYMIQAREIAMPFFLLGYHMIHASLLSEE